MILINFVIRNTFTAHLLFSTEVMRAKKLHVSGSRVMGVCVRLPCPRAPARSPQVGGVPDLVKETICFSISRGICIKLQKVRSVNPGEKIAGDKVSGESVCLPAALASSRLWGPSEGESQGQGIRWTILSSLRNL